MTKASPKTARDQAVEKVYSETTIKLGKSGQSVRLRELTFAHYGTLSRFLSGIIVNVFDQVIDSEGNPIPEAQIDKKQAFAAAMRALSADPEATYSLMAAMTGLTVEKITALPSGDGAQLLEGCVKMIDSADVQRFFAAATASVMTFAGGSASTASLPT